MADIFHRCKGKGAIYSACSILLDFHSFFTLLCSLFYSISPSLLAILGVIVPTVYQGCYNALTRSMEYEAAACLRELGIRSYHYNPLAGGMLSGKYSGIDDEAMKDGGRFGSASPISGAGYSARYWHQQYFDALEGIRAACDGAPGGVIPMAEASLRWIMNHSYLSAEHNDGIIFGASSIDHCVSNLDSCGKGPLPQSVLDAFTSGWKIVESVSSGYFRGYGAAAGTSEIFLAKFQANLPPPL